LFFSGETRASRGTADVERKELHFRRVDMRGYCRSDGLFEVEGRVTDRKPYSFTPGGCDYTVAAHEPIHDMGVRLIFDQSMVVHEIQTFTNAAPYNVCPEGGLALQSLKGLRIGSGWGAEVRKRLGGPVSCTHLMELLIPLATTAIQAMSVVNGNTPKSSGKPWQIDSCYAYASHSEQVLKRWPEYHRPKSQDS
jgi:Protein of unknown function (DUF2889)